MPDIELAENEASQRYDVRLRRINQSVLIVVALLTLFVGGVVWLLLDQIYDQQEQKTQERLSLSLTHTEKVLDIWQTQLARELQSIASEPVTIAETTALLGAYDRSEDLLTHTASQNLRKRFEELAERTHHLGFFIIAPDGTSLSSMRDQNIGSRNLIANQRPDLLARVYAGETVLIPPILSDVKINGEDLIPGTDFPASMFIAAPIFGARGNVIAVLTKRMSPLGSFSSLISLGVVAAEGSTYAYDYDGSLISHIEGQHLLSTKIPFLGTHLDTDITMGHYIGFRDGAALGVHQYFPDRGIGVATEIPIEIAFSTYYQIRRLITLTLVAVFAAGLVFTAGLILANRQSNAILQKNTRRLELINTRLKLRDEQREEMVFTLSHDLRSPLTNISRFNSRMLSEYDGQLDESQQHYLTRIGKNVERMSKLIESLFQVLQVESAVSRKAWIQSREVVDEVLDMMREDLQSVNGTLNITSELPAVFADANMLFDSLEILISNAIIYHEPSRPLEIKINAVSSEIGVSISIQDNGMGIDSNQQTDVFRIFKKVNITGGHGIGLTIVKSVMEKQGGSVSLESELGVGSTLTLHFPNDEFPVF